MGKTAFMGGSLSFKGEKKKSKKKSKTSKHKIEQEGAAAAVVASKQQSSGESRSAMEGEEDEEQQRFWHSLSVLVCWYFGVFEVPYFGIRNLEKCPGIRAATRAAYKDGLLGLQIARFLCLYCRGDPCGRPDFKATLVVAQISKVPNSRGCSVWHFPVSGAS